MSASVPNSLTIREEISHSATFSDTQVDLINSMIKFHKLMIEYIIVKGPDSIERKLNPMVFTIGG